MSSTDAIMNMNKRVQTTPLREQLPRELYAVQPLDSTTYVIKGWLDRLAAAIMLVPAIPLIALLVMAIRLTSRGPGIYSQTRVGKGGRIFTMYKLRSMRVDAEAGTGAVWAGLSADSRVTRLGYWLRRLHLDELPQLFNVVKGEMSLVGPRPERPEFVKVLADQIDGYLDRLKVMPGITGLAQINLPADTDLNSVRRKLVLDREYIDTAGILLDARIIFCTLFRTIGLRNGRAVQLMGLKRSVDDSSFAPSESSLTATHCTTLRDTTVCVSEVARDRETTANRPA